MGTYRQFEYPSPSTLKCWMWTEQVCKDESNGEWIMKNHLPKAKQINYDKQKTELLIF